MSFHNRLDRVLVEPEPDEYQRLKNVGKTTGDFIVIGTALGQIDGKIKIFETINPTCSSALLVNYEYLNQYTIKDHFLPRQTAFVPCARYDTLFARGGLPIPHMIKIDVQGYEFQVLQGFGALLQDCLAIELEAHFYELYREQKTLGELISFLSTYGFVLRKLSNSRSPNLNGDRHFDGDLVEVDATFTKSRQWFSENPERNHPDFGIICQIFGVDAYS